MRRPIFYVTGTDTGVGKTVLTTSLTRRLIERGIDVASLKPLCSGSRSDAVAIQRIVADRFGLDYVNPWYFRAPLAPAIAARAEGRRVRGQAVVDYIRSVAMFHAITIVEGAGGLLSPMTTDLDAAGIIDAVRAIPIVVCPNRLGAINQSLLVVRALPRARVSKVRVVLMSLARPDHSADSNVDYLRDALGSGRVFEFPWLDAATRNGLARPNSVVRRVLDSLVCI